VKKWKKVQSKSSPWKVMKEDEEALTIICWHLSM